MLYRVTGVKLAKVLRWWWKATDHRCPVQDLHAQLQHCCDRSVRFPSAKKFSSDLWHLKVFGRGSKEKGKCNVWGGADYDHKPRGRPEKQWHSCSNKKGKNIPWSYTGALEIKTGQKWDGGRSSWSQAIKAGSQGSWVLFTVTSGTSWFLASNLIVS